MVPYQGQESNTNKKHLLKVFLILNNNVKLHRVLEFF